MYSRNYRHRSTTPVQRHRTRTHTNTHTNRNRPQLKHADIARFINKAVALEPTAVFAPRHTFSDFNIIPRLKEAIVRKGYKEPTPIQDSAIEHILQARDIIGIANTGTGKTAAFLIPLIHKVLTQPRERVLIIIPTRELATQIGEELHGFARQLNVRGVICVGGTSIGPQIRNLRTRPQFVIGTPGRLKDLLEQRAINLGEFRTAVLDEADRMLDMGFIKDIRQLLSHLPRERHTLFFSATLSPDIRKLVGEFLRNPLEVSVTTRETAASIEQGVVHIPPGESKLTVLKKLLARPEFSKVLVFGRTKHGVEKLSRLLIQNGFRAESIHGNKQQGRRQRALESFKRAHIQVLVATDVAARGLDIDSVSHVINYDMPASHEDYIHRIGRTGRAGKQGKALTFIEQTS